MRSYNPSRRDWFQRVGLHLIQVGRKQEVNAVLTDLDRIADGGAAFRVIEGNYGSGKSFFLNLVKSLALQKNLLVLQADITMERRIYSRGGEAQALFSELMRNLATKARPEGGRTCWSHRGMDHVGAASVGQCFTPIR